MYTRIILLFSVIVCFFVCLFVISCSTSHKVQIAPVEIKPIHITIDVNVKVDRALDNFFGDLDNAATKIKE